MEKLKVVELFAGVGGFRLGLENTELNRFEVTWANQWEPGKKVQHAFDCYASRFETGKHVNEDIAEVTDREMSETNADLIVGGFPCQDYSVARSLNGELGISGKKGVLFWEITRFIQNTIPKYVLLENVDRLLKSPSKQRGRDFAVMLSTLHELGYDVEWRVINAAEYGNAQRRRRIFIFAYRRNMTYGKEMAKLNGEDFLYNKGMFARAFPVKEEPYKNRVAETEISGDIVDVSDNFSFEFHNTGIMRNGEITTIHTIPVEEPATPLREIIEENYDGKYVVDGEKLEKFKYLRGQKKEERTAKNGHKYFYTEGGMSESDSLDLPGRTMLTSEGSINRSTHLIKMDGKYRTLTPIEAERLNGFPDGWTDTMPERTRYFCMGNALVVPLITRMGNEIEKIDIEYPENITQLELL
ncbi:DNA (cytosine-5-)-methyltransferase [Salinicoccus siamensis]|uniref:Cytosine-specific methyltransferase n=1 Tax=Salinicoccus siamensis TaxID=381830 RepID=A0ABV5Z529_9STAP